MKIVLPWFAAMLSVAHILTGCQSPKAGPSSVRMTRTVARLASMKIDLEVSALCDSFST
jgi:hypothetical protein